MGKERGAGEEGREEGVGTASKAFNSDTGAKSNLKPPPPPHPPPPHPSPHPHPKYARNLPCGRTQKSARFSVKTAHACAAPKCHKQKQTDRISSSDDQGCIPIIYNGDTAPLTAFVCRYQAHDLPRGLGKPK